MPNEQKMKELILYVCIASENDPRFGATKLNKILFYSDFIAYQRLGESITGVEYCKRERGPAPRRLIPFRNALIAEGRLVLRTADYHGNKQDRHIALNKPDLSMFMAPEIAVVAEVIKALWELTAKEVSKLSHRFHSWELANLGETIPYEVALVGYPDECTDEELKLAQSLEREAENILAAKTSAYAKFRHTATDNRTLRRH